MRVKIGGEGHEVSSKCIYIVYFGGGDHRVCDRTVIVFPDPRVPARKRAGDRYGADAPHNGLHGDLYDRAGGFDPVGRDHIIEVSWAAASVAASERHRRDHL